MKTLSLISLSLLALTAINAQEKLSDEDKASAKEWLQKAKESYQTSNKSRLKKAEAALTTAISNENAALQLYTNAMKQRIMEMSSNMNKGGMRMMGGSSQDTSPTAMFQNWKKQNLGSNMPAGFKKALQIQCKWLLLAIKTIEAERLGNKPDVTAPVTAIVDEICANAKDLAGTSRSVGGAAWAIKDYLDINDYRSQTITDSPFDVSGLFDRILLKQSREDKDIPTFRNLYAKRIQLESILNADTTTTDKKEAATNNANNLLDLKWGMEKACFELGDEVTSLKNMKTILGQMRDPASKARAIQDLESIISTGKVSSSSSFDGRSYNRGSKMSGGGSMGGGPNGGPGGGGRR